MTNFINGNKFSELGDIVIDLDNPEISFDINVNGRIYCKTDLIKPLLKYLTNSTASHILITSMSDRPINKELFDLKPICIKKWFSANATYNHEDLIPIPLGIENHRGLVKGGHTDHEWLKENIERLQNTKKDNEFYCNWETWTNKKVRRHVISQLRENNLSLCIEHSLSYEGYCNSMASHKYIICPEGNGVDTHRLWEALYFGCIPIVIKNNIYKNYNLPILQIDSFSGLTQDVIDDFLKKDFSLTELDMDYWIKKIKNEFTILTA